MKKVDSGILTIEEIERQFPHQWVGLVDVVQPRFGDIRSARVIICEATKTEALTSRLLGDVEEEYRTNADDDFCGEIVFLEECERGKYD